MWLLDFYFTDVSVLWYKLRQSHAEECCRIVPIELSKAIYPLVKQRHTFAYVSSIFVVSALWPGRGVTFSISMCSGRLRCTQLYWNYRVIDMDPQDDVSESDIVTYAVMILREKLQFVLQPAGCCNGWHQCRLSLEEIQEGLDGAFTGH